MPPQLHNACVAVERCIWSGSQRLPVGIRWTSPSSNFATFSPEALQRSRLHSCRPDAMMITMCRLPRLPSPSTAPDGTADTFGKGRRISAMLSACRVKLLFTNRKLSGRKITSGHASACEGGAVDTRAVKQTLLTNVGSPQEMGFHTPCGSLRCVLCELFEVM